MERSSFFNAVLDPNGNPDRVYLAEDFANYFNKFITNGVFPSPETGLQVISNSNMAVRLKKGAAYICGYLYENTDDLLLNIDVADGVLKRIDRVVLKLDYLQRKIYTYVKKGTLSSNPIAPVLQRDIDAYELGVADVLVNNGATSIIQANITDLRSNNAYCGIVNNLFAMQNIQASAVYTNNTNGYYDATNVETALDEIRRPLNVHRLNLDATNNIYTIVEWRRSDNTIFKRSVLSNISNNNYLTQTITYYSIDGTTVKKTEVFALSYDASGNLQNEVKQ